MRCILYIQSRENNNIPELELYQIFINLYREKAERDLILFQVKKHDENTYYFETTKKLTEEDFDSLHTQREIIEVSDDERIEKIISDYLHKLDEKYEVYIILSGIGQTRLMSNFINEIITIKKDEIAPLQI